MPPDDSPVELHRTADSGVRTGMARGIESKCVDDVHVVGELVANVAEFEDRLNQDGEVTKAGSSKVPCSVKAAELVEDVKTTAMVASMPLGPM